MVVGYKLNNDAAAALADCINESAEFGLRNNIIRVKTARGSANDTLELVRERAPIARALACNPYIRATPQGPRT
jgi:hypothetical protein